MQSDTLDTRTTNPVELRSKAADPRGAGAGVNLSASSLSSAASDPQVDRGELRNDIAHAIIEESDVSRLIDRILALLPAQPPAQGDADEKLRELRRLVLPWTAGSGALAARFVLTEIDRLLASPALATPTCAICDREIATGKRLCSNCDRGEPAPCNYTAVGWCNKCGKVHDAPPDKPDLPTARTCDQCRNWSPAH